MWAKGLAASGKNLRAIFLTHHHIDHVGGLEFFAKALDLEIWAHEETFRRLPETKSYRTRSWSEGDILDLATADDPGASEAPHCWRVLFTPGHAPGHLCLFEETARTLIVGDMVASEGTILIDPDEGDMGRYLEELRRLRGLDATMALPAHGAPILEPNAVFDFYVAHRLKREGKVLAALAEWSTNAPPTANAPPGALLQELLPIAYADTPEALWPLAELSLRAHLLKLVRDGKVLCDETIGNAEATAARKGFRWRTISPKLSP